MGDNSDLTICELEFGSYLAVLVANHLAAVQPQEGLLDVVVEALGHDLIALVWVLLQHVLLCQIGKVGENHWKENVVLSETAWRLMAVQ